MLRSWRELRDARRKGRRDGRAGVPNVDQDALPFSLREILARAEERVLRLVQGWTRDVHALETELADLTDRSSSAEARLADAEMQHDVTLAEHERRTLEDDAHLAVLQGQLEDLPTAEPVSLDLDESPLPGLDELPTQNATAPARINPNPASTESARTSASAVELADAGGHGMTSVVYWALILLVVLGEISLNAFAFRLFHEADLLTYAMTVTVAVALVAMAHVVGLFLSRLRRTTVERVVVAVCILVPVAVISVIALVRYGYLQDVGGDSGIGPVLGTLAFGSINLLVFGAAAGLSYLHHDPRTLVNRRATVRATEKERSRLERHSSEEELARVRREQRLEDEARKRTEEAYRRRLDGERRRRLQELELRTSRRQAEIEIRKSEVLARREEIAESMRPIREAARARAERVAELGEPVHQARASLGALRVRIDSIEGDRRALWASTNAAIREVKARSDRLVFAYCSANVRARRGHEHPCCLDQVPALEFPVEFRDAMVEVSR